MSELQYFEVVGDRAEYRPIGQLSLAEGGQLVKSAIALAREQHIGKLLVVTFGVTGVEPPSVTDRYYFVREWVEACGKAVRVALVARPEMIDFRKFGVIVAANRGVTTDIFASEEEALAWLQSA